MRKPCRYVYFFCGCDDSECWYVFRSLGLFVLFYPLFFYLLATNNVDRFMTEQDFQARYPLHSGIAAIEFVLIAVALLGFLIVMGIYALFEFLQNVLSDCFLFLAALVSIFAILLNALAKDILCIGTFFIQRHRHALQKSS